MDTTWVSDDVILVVVQIFHFGTMNIYTVGVFFYLCSCLPKANIRFRLKPGAPPPPITAMDL